MPTQSDRIENLDTLRGVAVLGILIMNGVSFGLGNTAYFNISFDTDSFSVERSVAIAGEIIADQKFMALFSILFGAGIVLFHERLSARYGNAKAIGISLWRNLLLLAMGAIHSIFWVGDILLIYAFAAPLILVVRNLPIVVLFAMGVGILLLSPVGAVVIQRYIEAQGTPLTNALGEYWINPELPMSDTVGVWLIFDFTVRAVSMMLLGIGLYRIGYLSGAMSARLYGIIALSGIAIGWVLAAMGVLWLTAKAFSPEIALVGGIPNTLGTLPAVLGYIAIITLCARYLHKSGLHRIQAIGRIALTNYLSQTMLGLFVFSYWLDSDDVSRTTVVLFVGGVWVLQLWWSAIWLRCYTQGPMEWLWRCATHRRWLPLRREHTEFD